MYGYTVTFSIYPMTVKTNEYIVNPSGVFIVYMACLIILDLKIWNPYSVKASVSWNTREQRALLVQKPDLHYPDYTLSEKGDQVDTCTLCFGFYKRSNSKILKWMNIRHIDRCGKKIYILAP